jgi:hypothetical protein
MGKKRITAMLTLVLGLLLLKVTAGYAAPCTSALANIDPTSVNINAQDQAFSYYIEPTISAGDSGIDKINIVVPSSYSDVQVTSVSVGGSSPGYNDNSSRNTISVTLDTKVTVDGTDIRVNFTAHTPNSPDSGVAFTSTVDDTENSAPVNCTEGSWTVTASYAGSCTSAVAEISPTSVNMNSNNQAFSYYIEPTINPDDSGINKIEIVVPGSYSHARVTSVSVGGSQAGYNNNSSRNTISVTLDAKVTVDGTDLRVNFTAHTPGSPDSGVAFTSTVDDTDNPDPVNCQSGDGDDGGSIATDTWTVTASYAGSCTSAVAEISPTSVSINTDDQAFSYYIEPTINPDDSGINKIEIVVPDSYSDVQVTSVSVGGSTAGYNDNSSGNTISVTLDTKVTVNGTDLQVNFTADTPNSADSGVAFLSTVDDTENPDPVSCTDGSWTVTASYAGSCTSAVAEISPTSVNVNSNNQAFSYYIEPTISPDDSGINKIEIVVPGSYSDVLVTSVSVGGSPAGYDDSDTSGNTISVTLDTKVTVNGTDLQVNFTADTPNSADSGVAFLSTVDDTENSAPVNCTDGSWTVTASYAGSCTSAVAEISPTSVNVNSNNQAFSYYIEPTISPDDSGIDKIEIVAPGSYSDVQVTSVSVGNTSPGYNDNSSGNTISVTLHAKVTVDGTDLRVNFTAHTPNSPDSGVAFLSTVDDTENSAPANCTDGSWTVTASYAGSCTSAVAEIDPTSVNINTDNQAFSYYIEPTINPDDSGIDKIDIVVPGSYSDVQVTSVSVGGSPAGYDDSDTSANTISVTLDTKVTVDGTDLRVNFTAHTPNSPDSGVAFLSTVDDTENPDPVSCTDGSWTVTASYAGSCTSAVAEISPTSVNVNTDNQAFSYYIEPTISPDDSGINKIVIEVPAAYSNVKVMDVLVAGVRVSHSDNTSINTISLTLEDKVIIDGTDIQINFTAHTPDAVDSGTAFRSTVDDTSYPGSVSCTPGDGDGGGSIATDTWTVRAGYAGPCASAVAEIDPTDVNIKTKDQAFSYYIEPTISTDDSGINKIEIVVPDSYSHVRVTSVSVGGSPAEYDNSDTSANTISVTLDTKVTVDGTDLRVNFTAHTPNSPDSGVEFLSTVDDTENSAPVNCSSGDGDGGGSVSSNTWKVTAGYAGPCTSAVAEIDPTDVNIKTDDQAFSYYIEPTISPDDSGINKIDIVVPGSYSHVEVTSVSVGNTSPGYNDNSSGNTISVTLHAKVTVNGTDLRVNFTAHTPNSPDSGVAFLSTVDDSQNPDPVNCTDGSWTVTAGYAGPCTSAVAEIDPTDVNIKTDDQAFFYYIEPTISTDDSGINKIEIVVPGSYSDVRVTSVLVGGDTLSDYDNNSSGNTISVTLDTKVTVDGTGLRVNFTADTPNSPDSGVAFPSTVDDTENSEPVRCQSGDGDSGGDIATNTWTVTAGYAGPCTSAVAEIEPTYVNINTDDQAFSYYIRPTINPDDSGVDKIEIRVPDTYSDVKVTGVSVGDDTSSEYDNNSSGNTISVTLRIKVTKNGTELRVNFTADTPYAVDSGVKFTSTVDNTSNFDPVACTSGDGEGSVSTDTWIVTAPLSDGGNACFIATAASGFTMEPRLKVFGEFCDRILLSNKAARSLVELYYYTCFSYCGRLHNGT